MLKKISAQKARQRFGEMMDEVRLRGDRYIVERGNRPMVAVIPVEEYVTWEKIRERLYEKIRQIREKNKGVDSEVLESEIKKAVEAARQI
jgi:prevent-host-death family protein